LISFRAESKQDNVHIEIDGEYFNIEQPHSIYVQQSEGFKNGKINVLVLNDQEVKAKRTKFVGKSINFKARTKILEKKL
jgi:hypothetical protein